MTAPILHLFETVSAPAAGLLVSSVWKGLVLIVCVAALLRCVPRFSAGVRSAVWTAVLLVTLLLPVLSLQASSAGAGARSMVHASGTWSLSLFAVWIALSLLRLAQLGASALRLRIIARRAVPAATSDAVATLLGCSARQVALCVSGDVCRPSVVGFFRPSILLPAGLLEVLSETELEHVVLHELEHLRRRDDWTNLLQKLSLALFPLHPALLWLDRRLCLERELACDDGVLRVTRARKTYAACLARLAEDSMVRRGLLLALGLLGVLERRSELSGRVHRILRNPAPAMSRAQGGLVTALLLAGLLGGSMVLARTPRLVSFDSESRPVTESQMPAVPVLSMPALAHESSGREAMVKAILPPPRPRLTPVITAVARKPHAARRVALAGQQRTAPAVPYVVLTEWRATTIEQPRMTLTLAHYSQTPQVSQQTYAAVPVQGGWLLIQL